jgi:hypothetical protein
VRTFFVTFLHGEGGTTEPDWAEVHADNVAQVARVAENHGWRIMSLHDTACWRPKMRIDTQRRLELLELDRFLHYRTRGRNEDPFWLSTVRGRADSLRRTAPAT